MERELEKAEGQGRKQKLDPEWQRATCPSGADSARSLRSLLRNSPPTGKESTVKKNVPGENMEGKASNQIKIGQKTQTFLQRRGMNGQ